MMPRTSEERTANQLNRVFFALSDITRRTLLDRLYLRDGQRLAELVADFEISRQSISRHLEVLEEAGLIVTKRPNRETLHFLNRAPMRNAQNMWFEKYTRLQVKVDCF